MTAGRHAVALLNGVAADAVGVLDRGLHYGDGLFETVAVIDGEPRLLDRHIARLRAGAARLRLPEPPVKDLCAEVWRLAQGHDRAVVKLLYTRGEGGRGYLPPVAARPNRLLIRYPAPDYPASAWQRGVDVTICSTRLGSQPLLAGLKHLNRLEQVLARAECDQPGIAEGLLLDNNGQVVEGTQSNVFAVIDDRLLTPRLDQAGVAGVMRAWVMDWASVFGVVCEETALTLADLTAAKEAFLTNSVIGVWPVATLAGKALPERGIARELIASLRAARLCLISD